MPSRGTAVVTISTLLEHCKLASMSQSLMPPPSASMGGKKSGYVLNSVSSHGSNVVQCVDKSTNTNTISTTGFAGNIIAAAAQADSTSLPSFESNGKAANDSQSHARSRKHLNQKNGNVMCTTQISITDVCDRTNEIEIYACQKQQRASSEPPSHIGSDAENQNVRDNDSGDSNNGHSVNGQMKHSNRELNFLSLELRCMCSDDGASNDNSNAADSGAVNQQCKNHSRCSGTRCNQCKMHHITCSHSTVCSKNCSAVQQDNSISAASSQSDDRITSASSNVVIEKYCDENCENTIGPCARGEHCAKHSTNDETTKSDNHCCCKCVPNVDGNQIDPTHKSHCPQGDEVHMGGTGSDAKSSFGDVSDLQPETCDTIDANLSLSKPSTDDEDSAKRCGDGDGGNSNAMDSANASANASTTKRSKPSDKLVLDLNDRSKYTKEVSV